MLSVALDFNNDLCLRAKKVDDTFAVYVRALCSFLLLFVPKNPSSVRLFIDRDEISILRDGGDPVAFLVYLVEDFAR